PGLDPSVSEFCFFPWEFDDSEDDTLPVPDVVPPSAHARPAPASIAMDTPAVRTPALNTRRIIPTPIPIQRTVTRPLDVATRFTWSGMGVRRPSLSWPCMPVLPGRTSAGM